MTRAPILLAIALLAACQGTPRGDEDERFYSYVDAQGNLVTVERETREPEEGEADASPPGKGETERGSSGVPSEPRSDPEAEATTIAPDEEEYQTAEEVQARIQEQIDADEEDRFVTYRGPEGEIITRPLDLPAEREAAENRPRDYEELPEGGNYLETVSRVPADCCKHLPEEAMLLDRGDSVSVRFRPGKGSMMELDRQRPARVYRLGPELGAIHAQSYIDDNRYLAPHALILNEDGMPVLKINNLFTRHYPETWARYAYMDGRVERAPDFAYLVLYLPYARTGEGGITLDPDASLEASDYQPALQGDLVITGRRGNPSVSRGSDGGK